MNSARVFRCAAIALGVLSACVDLSPGQYSEPDASDASTIDAVAVVDVANRDAFVAECKVCLSSGPCAALVSACDGDMACAAVADCLTASLCWASSLTDLAHLPPCLLSCAATAGVTSQNSPSVLLASPVFVCAQDPARCGNVCAPGLGE
jgi:hypothetical protein